MKKIIFYSLSLWLLTSLNACFYVQHQHPAELDAWQNVSQLSQILYATFPQAPRTHIIVSYDQMSLSGTESVVVQNLNFYLPISELDNPTKMAALKQKVHHLFQTWHPEHMECLTVNVSEQEHHFEGIPEALKEVEVETACA